MSGVQINEKDSVMPILDLQDIHINVMKCSDLNYPELHVPIWSLYKTSLD